MGSSRLEAVYREHWRYVWRCARKLGVADDRLEDVLHDVFVVVCRRLDEFEGRSSVNTWLYGITFRVVQEHHRKLGRDRRPAPATSGSVAGPEEHVQRVEAAKLLGELLAELDEDKRMAFVLTEIDGMSPNAVAEMLGVSVNTVYSRLRLARERLDRAVARRKAQAKVRRVKAVGQ